MHDGLQLVGPLIWVLIVLGVAVAIGAVVMIVGAVRRPRHHFGTFGAWPYAVVGAVYLAVAVVGPTRILPVTPETGLLVVVTFLVTMVVEIRYALRVLFPSPRRLAARGDDPVENEVTGE